MNPSFLPPVETPMDSPLWRRAIVYLFNVVARGAGLAPYAVTPPASPFTMTNTHQYAVDVALTGGTVTGLVFSRTIQGRAVSVTLATTTPAVMLSPGDQITITYSSAPTVTIIAR